MVLILLRTSVALLLLVIFVTPCATTLYRHNRQNVFESLHQVEEGGNLVQSSSYTKNYYNSKQLRLWNESWPTVVKLKHELIDRNGPSADRPYALSKSCLDDVQRLVYGVSVLDGWALQMVDASGKLPSGVFLGNGKWFGMYDECLEVSSKQSQAHQQDNNNNSTVLGEYCLVDIGGGSNQSFIAKLELRLGICIPRSCNSTDAMALINIVLSNVTDDIYATAVDCSDGSPIPLDTGAIAVITVLCVLGALLLLGTCLDYTRNHGHREMVPALNMKNGKIEPDENSPLLDGTSSKDQQPVVVSILDTEGNLYRFLIAFSVLSNAKKVLPVESHQTNKSLEVLNGIRFLSFSWMILLHTYLMAFEYTSNPIEYINWFGSFSLQPITNGTLCVDNFFLLSGALSAYALLKDFRAKGELRKINWPYFYFHRFWRLTPLYMLVLAIYATLFKYFGSGPLWPKDFGEGCKTSWWNSLLYINNIVPGASEMCISSAWYLAAVMQFFLLMPVFVALLYKCPLLGGIVIFVFMLASSITTGVITYVNHYPPSDPGFYYNSTLTVGWYRNVYIVPWCRINTYLIGILLGYILYKSNGKLRIHKALVVLGWCLAAACNLSVLYGLYEVGRGHPMSPSVSALYASVHRTVWSVGVAWVILVCATGNGGFLNRLLSLPIMQSLSQLQYAAYLVQELVIFWYYKSLKVPLFANNGTMVLLFLGILVLSYGFGFVFFILIEAPTRNLDRLLLRNR